MVEYEVEIYRREDDKFGWRLVHSNGNIVADDAGQGYENRQDCVEMANKIGNASWSVVE